MGTICKKLVICCKSFWHWGFSNVLWRRTKNTGGDSCEQNWTW